MDWALSEDAKDLRQLALVFDWCGPVMADGQADRLAAEVQRALAGAASGDVRQQSVRAFAAIALADRLADHGESVLKPLIEQWWRGEISKNLEAGAAGDSARSGVCAAGIAARRARQLKDRPAGRRAGLFQGAADGPLSSHYPAPYPAAENEYRIPIYVRDGEPDLHDAALSRAAELAMVAYDANAADNQFLQGWLMQDRFLMRGGFGVPYEFLWANPYQPGLSYFQMPLVYHDSLSGHLFARTSWDENATWLGYFDGQLQLFRDGKVETLKAGAATEPVHVGEAIILSAREKDATRFQADAEAVFVLNLTPRAHYDVEIDDQELREEETDTGGTLVIALPEGIATGSA